MEEQRRECAVAGRVDPNPATDADKGNNVEAGEEATKPRVAEPVDAPGPRPDLLRVHRVQLDTLHPFFFWKRDKEERKRCGKVIVYPGESPSLKCDTKWTKTQS